MVAMSNDCPGLFSEKIILQVIFYISGLTWKVEFYVKLPISIVQRAYIPKNGVEFRQQSNGDNRTGIATSYDIARRRQYFGTHLCTHHHHFLIGEQCKAMHKIIVL